MADSCITVTDDSITGGTMPFLKAFEELARLRVWLFLYATRLVEFINALLIISFSTDFLVDAYDGHIAIAAKN